MKLSDALFLTNHRILLNDSDRTLGQISQRERGNQKITKYINKQRFLQQNISCSQKRKRESYSRENG